MFGLAACERGGEERPTVVLYSSVDDYVLREVIEDFESKHDIDVELVGDTEATKTTGLVQRLLLENESPRADVWWSSEPFGTITLAEAGVLAPMDDSVMSQLPDWPARLIGRGTLWVGFAQRARVIAYNTNVMDESEVPTTLRGLADPKYKGRVGIARPAFGTTRGHMAMLLDEFGEQTYRDWLEAMEANGVRVYDGNATVVRAVAEGEIDLCLTDTDDVWAGQRTGWPVGLVYESVDDGSADGLPSVGPLVIPNTVARVRGGPNEDAAGVLLAYLLSADLERLMAQTDSHNVPVRPELAAEFAEYAVPSPADVELESVASRASEAVEIANDVLD